MGFEARIFLECLDRESSELTIKYLLRSGTIKEKGAMSPELCDPGLRVEDDPRTPGLIRPDIDQALRSDFFANFYGDEARVLSIG